MGVEEEEEEKKGRGVGRGESVADFCDKTPPAIVLSSVNVV